MLLNLGRKCNCKRKLTGGNRRSSYFIKDEKFVVAFAETGRNREDDAFLGAFGRDPGLDERLSSGVLDLQQENGIGLARCGGDVKEKIEGLARLNFDASAGGTMDAGVDEREPGSDSGSGRLRAGFALKPGNADRVLIRDDGDQGRERRHGDERLEPIEPAGAWSAHNLFGDCGLDEIQAARGGESNAGTKIEGAISAIEIVLFKLGAVKGREFAKYIFFNGLHSHCFRVVHVLHPKV